MHRHYVGLNEADAAWAQRMVLALTSRLTSDRIFSGAELAGPKEPRTELADVVWESLLQGSAG